MKKLILCTMLLCAVQASGQGADGSYIGTLERMADILAKVQRLAASEASDISLQ